tara:strand:+ start:69 stop:914 length:846 start_codon:yes stop_codon:yes gene_type:complete
MYSFYEITLCTPDIKKLTYKVYTHKPAQTWAKLINNCNVNQLRKSLNPIRAINNMEEKINELMQLIEKMNLWIPTKIITFSNDDTIANNLNRLHIHFPELEKSETDTSRLEQLSAYNDLIHELETLNVAKKFNKNFSYILICPDIHNELNELISIEDFKYFTPNRNIGDLMLHYCHVGRHPLELYLNNDVNCPVEQIVPQYKISPYHTLRFSKFTLDWNKFTNFYYDSKLTWPYEITDPKLAVGYIPIGTLIKINDVEVENNTMYQELLMPDTTIIGWKIY